jgi:hypothetical protein
MPRGVRGSGKSRKPAVERARPRRRGRKVEEHPFRAIQAHEESRLPQVDASINVEEQASSARDSTQDPGLQAAERQLIEKYSLVNIKVGSLRGAGGRPAHPGKRTVIILCGRCNRERVLATSDLFHVRFCPACTKIVRKDKKATKP